MNLISIIRYCMKTGVRFNSTSANHKCKLLILGGGSGGCSTAAKFSRKLDKNNIIIVEPSDIHYYQPMFTLVGGGIKNIQDTYKPMRKVLPKDVNWIKDYVMKIDPKSCIVTTANGTNINYEYLIIALGIELHYEKIKGLVEALEADIESGVCSNYYPKYAVRTENVLRKFKKGNAVFTFPNTPVKCAGAPLKACLISENFIRNAGYRDKSNIYFRTSLPFIFAVKHYRESLLKLCNERNINIAVTQELVEVNSKFKEAVFKDLKSQKLNTLKYDMLHVTPPMTAPQMLSCDKSLVDDSGFLRVNNETLQHVKYENIYGIGDCTNLPTSKTAAAVAAQSGILYDNLMSTMDGKKVKAKYDGYTSCPLVTGFGKCILAEFDYDLQPLETFPIDQSRENVLMYFMKKDVMPTLYWQAMLKGYWRGPGLVRRILHLGLGK